jgi:deazaflavin-dependent oxidoreductase (nitroreductase family)
MFPTAIGIYVSVTARANDWNRTIIEEFRANEGHVARFGRQPLLLLHHMGAKTGTWRVNPLAYQRLEDGSVAVFGSKGGSPRHPDWYFNLVANHNAGIEIGTETYDVVARVAEGEERERIWKRQKGFNRAFADYERKTARRIPVIILERTE